MTILLPVLGVAAESNGMYIKGLQEINRKTILQHVYDSLESVIDANFIAIVRKEDVRRCHIDNILRLIIPDVKIVIAEGNTSGSACTCLLAIDLLDLEDSLVITGSNQIVTVPVHEAISKFSHRDLDGGLITFEDVHPKWSYVSLDINGFVVEAAEKRPISRHAATGFYYFKRTGDFIEGAKTMIKKGASINGNYYVCPVYNELILKQKRIGIHEISKWEYFNLGCEQGIHDYEKYLTGKGINE